MARFACEDVCHCLVQLSAESFILGTSGDKCPFLVALDKGSQQEYMYLRNGHQS